MISGLGRDEAGEISEVVEKLGHLSLQMLDRSHPFDEAQFRACGGQGGRAR